MVIRAADPFEKIFVQALDAREPLLQTADCQPHDCALRLFNGFLEGYPELVVDLYARTALLQNYASQPQSVHPAVENALNILRKRYPWLQSAVLKVRSAANEADRRGRIIFGEAASRKVREHGVWYALDLTMNLDASLYLDTRNLRAWALANLAEKRVLNTFAYTGSLGVAAAAGGARQVIHTDLNRRFLNLAKDSYALNGLPVNRADFIDGDFWVQVNQLKRSGTLFDCVFVDPPFFSTTDRGTVDLLTQSGRVINKVRPLVAHGGTLVAINNALFLSGSEYMRLLEEICSDGYLSIEQIIPVPPDFTGFSETSRSSLPVDPAPFNHATKIVILTVRRKDQRASD